MKSSPHYRSLPRRFRRPTLLIVGCGDVGRRIGTQLLARHPQDRLRVIGTVRSAPQAQALRALGIRPLVADLDARVDTRRAAALARWMIDLAPPPAVGPRDTRTTRLIAALRRAGQRPAAPRLATPRVASPRRWVYVSTTGVYGDCGGAMFDETRRVAPASARAIRRVDAERRVRGAVREGLARASILRVPGIYDAHDRLPLERLRKALPALAPQDDVYTNHIHADDLAAIARSALFRGRPGRVVHAVDDTDLRMGDYFDAVADALDLPRPPRVPRAELPGLVSAAMLSFMSESRRLANTRLKRELRCRLRYPTVHAALADVKKALL